MSGYIDNVPMIAKVCHQANKAWCEANGDYSIKNWEDTPEEILMTIKNGVRNVIMNPKITPEENHDNWVQAKTAAGYVYGEVKCDDKKTHPCMTAYSNLPEIQRKKDAMFISIVKALMSTQ